MALKIFRRKGAKTWIIRGTVRGESVYETTGTSDCDLAEAIRVKTESRLLEESVHGKKTLIKFEEAAVSYIESGGSRRFIAEKYKKGPKKDQLKPGLATQFRGRLLKDITQSELDKAGGELYPSAQPDTLNRQLYTPFIAIWNHSVGNEWADPKGWKRPRKAKGTNVLRIARVKRSGTAPVDYERAATFVSAMSPAPAMLMTSLFYTGLRPIEAFALTAPNVNVPGRWIVIPDSKTGEPRGVPMHEFLVPMFEALLRRNSLADDERVFRGPRGEPYKEVQEGGGGLKTAINGARLRLAREAYPEKSPREVTLAMSPIKDVSPYTARHTCSTGLVIAGVHPHIKDQILGHAADDMSRHYTNVPQAPLIEAINKLPVPDKWKALPWWQDPLAWSGKLPEGTGRRTDLERKKA